LSPSGFRWVTYKRAKIGLFFLLPYTTSPCFPASLVAVCMVCAIACFRKKARGKAAPGPVGIQSDEE